VPWGWTTTHPQGTLRSDAGKARDLRYFFFNIWSVDKKWDRWINTDDIGLPAGVCAAYNGTPEIIPLTPF